MPDTRAAAPACSTTSEQEWGRPPHDFLDTREAAEEIFEPSYRSDTVGEHASCSAAAPASWLSTLGDDSARQHSVIVARKKSCSTCKGLVARREQLSGVVGGIVSSVVTVGIVPFVLVGGLAIACFLPAEVGDLGDEEDRRASARKHDAGKGVRRNRMNSVVRSLVRRDRRDSVQRCAQKTLASILLAGQPLTDNNSAPLTSFFAPDSCCRRADILPPPCATQVPTTSTGDCSSLLCPVDSSNEERIRCSMTVPPDDERRQTSSSVEICKCAALFHNSGASLLMLADMLMLRRIDDAGLDDLFFVARSSPFFFCLSSSGLFFTHLRLHLISGCNALPP